MCTLITNLLPCTHTIITEVQKCASSKGQLEAQLLENQNVKDVRNSSPTVGHFADIIITLVHVLYLCHVHVHTGIILYMHTSTIV